MTELTLDEKINKVNAKMAEITRLKNRRDIIKNLINNYGNVDPNDNSFIINPLVQLNQALTNEVIINLSNQVVLELNKSLSSTEEILNSVVDLGI